MKTYHGSRGPSGVMIRILVDDRAELLQREETLQRPTYGEIFDWGVHNAGAAELSIAILADFKNAAYARAWYLVFKSEVIYRLPQAAFSLTEDQISNAMSYIHAGDSVPRDLISDVAEPLEPIGAMVQALTPGKE